MHCPDCGLQNSDTAAFCTGCGVGLKEVAVGSVLGGRYRVDGLLGHGGMGSVYRAWDERLECVCALKDLHAVGQTARERSEIIARFKREALTLRSLSHPGLPRVYDFFDDGGRYFLVQDFIEGDSFDAILARDGHPGLGEAEVCALCLEALDILAYLHGQSPPVLHRDVKPANFMRRAGSGQIVLVDFGIARRHAASTSTSVGTHVGTAIGTAEYCPPEQFGGSAVPASDLYALGATMHHLLTGKVPAPFQYPAPQGVSAALCAVLARATALNPADRYASASEMRQALLGAVSLLPKAAGAAPPMMPVSPAAQPAAFPAVGGASNPQQQAAGSRFAGAASLPPTQTALPGGPAGASSARQGARQAQSSRWASGVGIAFLTVLAGYLGPFKESAPRVPATPGSTVNAVDARRHVPATPSTRVNFKDGTVLIAIPGGTYTLGSAAGEGDDDELPPHQVTLKPYAIGKTEVTNAQYHRFLVDTGHKTAGDWDWKKWGDQTPVVHVTWHDAVAYCQWAGLRLPTEAEWEVAARGPDRLEYPWGQTFDPAKCQGSMGDELGSARRPAPAGSYPQGASPYGCLDLAGNVWEWCSSKHKPYPYDALDGRENLKGYDRRSLRGGSWCDGNPVRFRGAYRGWNYPGNHNDNVGFRCARTF